MITIRDIKVYPLNIPLTTPWKISFSTQTHCETVIVEIVSDSGLKGYGEASPFSLVTGDTVQSILAALDVLRPQLIGKNPLELRTLVELFDEFFAHNTAAKAGLDMALHDLAARHYQVPLYTLLGGKSREKVVTSLTAWLGTVEETLGRVAFLLEHGAQVIKLKVGQDVATDVERVRAIRERFGFDFDLRCDANQGYTPKETIEFAEQIDDCRMEFIEQPVPHDDIAGLKFVTDNSAIPIMADESIHSPSDVIRLCRERACDLINIKIMKAGGLLRAKEIATVAQAANIGCMLGAMLESKVGMAAATHLAASHPNILYADLDGHFDLAEDPTSGGIETTAGCNLFSDVPGTGLELNRKLIEKFCADVERPA